MKTVKEVAAENAPRASHGIIVARFQTPILTSAHLDLIKTVEEKHPNLVIFLGLTAIEESTANNPYDKNIRVEMLREHFPECQFWYIEDEECNVRWSTKLDGLIKKVIGTSGTALLYGSRDSFIPRYHGVYPVEELVAETLVSGTEARRQAGVKARRGADFRYGIAWAHAHVFQAPKVTVDTAVFNENKTKILLGRKAHEPLFRFMGGFITNKAPDFETDARREVFEESSGCEIGPLTYVCSALVPDWRMEGEVNKIKTILFAAKFVFGRPEPGDDMKGGELQWFDLETLTEDMVMPCHRHLVAKLKLFNPSVLG